MADHAYLVTADGAHHLRSVARDGGLDRRVSAVGTAHAVRQQGVQIVAPATVGRARLARAGGGVLGTRGLHAQNAGCCLAAANGSPPLALTRPPRALRSAPRTSCVGSCPSTSTAPSWNSRRISATHSATRRALTTGLDTRQPSCSGSVRGCFARAAAGQTRRRRLRGPLPPRGESLPDPPMASATASPQAACSRSA